MHRINVIAFDADDTLWENEPNFQKTEKAFCALMEKYLPAEIVSKELFAIEMENLSLYGYGAKAFVLSLIETLVKVSNGKADSQLVGEILDMGKALLLQPVILLPGVTDVLEQLTGNFKLVLATKGDLLDQERKLRNSGLEGYFHHIEIMSDKQQSDYLKLMRNLDCNPENFLMVGNSLKSDVLPVLQTGGYAAHIPFHTTWQYEKMEVEVDHPHFKELKHINELIFWLREQHLITLLFDSSTNS